jgi:formate dehydrogenase major subunit
MINLTIDGKPIEVQEATTVLNAARQAGIEIPTLCDHPQLSPYGGCRLCLVEVEGMRTLQPSCTLPAGKGMVVKTNTEKTKAARKFVLTLIFSERNHFCPYCQVSGGDCELQNAAYREGMTHWPLQPNWQPFPLDASHPYILQENNRCILCRRCVRACGELVGNFTLGFAERGTRSILVADLGVPLGTSSCISCGTCVQVCPTGALIDRWSAYKGRETQVEKTSTVCVGCSVGCGVNVLTRDNNLVRIEGNWDASVNEGVICKTGRFLPLDEKLERILTPLIRKDGSQKATTWKDALEKASIKLKSSIGKKSIAAVASSRLSAESLYLFKQIFADGLKSEMVTSLDESGAAGIASQMAQELGKPFEGNLNDLQQADCVVSFGVDLVKEHEVAGFMVKRNIPNGTKVIVIDSNPNEFSTWADLFIKLSKSIDPEVVRGLAAEQLKISANENKTKEDPTMAIADAIAKSGISEAQLDEAVKIIASAEKPVFVYGKGTSSETLKEIVNFAEVMGATVIGMKGEANSLAASQYGLDKSIDLKEYKSLVVVLGDDEITQATLKKLESAPYLVVFASHASALTAKADVVLPVQIWSEQVGHYLSLEGKLQESKKSLTSDENTHSNYDALNALAKELGIKVSDDWKKALSSRVASVEIKE